MSARRIRGVAAKLGGAAIVVAVIGWIAVSYSTPTEAAPSGGEALSYARDLGKAFTGVAKSVVPSVVTISSDKVIHTAGRMPEGHGEFDEFFGRFFGMPGMPGMDGGEVRQRALGSGVIVSDDGYIVTNNHVVSDAEEISVTLSSGDEFEAELVGTDPKTDVAVIKIDGKGLPHANLGDSDDVEVGEWVLAIGSPFSQELGATVTAGIVSATGRGLGLANYEDFIQTDAAINPGNSGGALVNLDGEVIGINTAIATRSGGSQGVGFAIPINMVRDIENDLIDDGKVTRGWIGIAIQPITKEFQEAFDLPNRSGVLVSKVEPGSPAEEAGLKQRDVIRYLNGEEIESFRAFRNEVARTEPGTRIRLGVDRGGKDKKITVVLGTFPEDGETPAASDRRSGEKLGIEVTNITPELQRRFNLDRSEGVVVTSVRRGSVAARNGIAPGDVILETNRTEVYGVSEYRKAIGKVDPGDVVLLLVERGDNTRFVALRVPKK